MVYISNGYVCAACGQWVWEGEQHSCQPWYRSSYNYISYDPDFAINGKLDKIISLLEEIVIKLEKE